MSGFVCRLAVFRFSCAGLCAIMRDVESCLFWERTFPYTKKGVLGFMGKKSGKMKGTGAGVIAFGAAFALISAVFHPHRPLSLLFTGVVSGLIGVVVGIMGSGLDTTPHNQKNDALNKVQEDTGNAEVDAVLAKGRQLIGEIRAENDRIPDSRLSAQLDALERECAEVFSVVYDKPGKLSQIRKFMEYYLPTTLKMVKGYRMLNERGVSGCEAMQARDRIGDVIDAVIRGAQKLKENLYQDDVLDINTDIDVMEQMLKRDGLTESDLQRVVTQARQAAQIDRAVDEVHRHRQQTEPTAKTAQAVSQAQEHNPTVPTMDGGVYTASASAYAQQKQ